MPGIHKILSNLRRTLPEADIIQTSLSLCPQLSLYLIEADRPHRPFSTREIETILANTPYWTFCWASGHALAHYLLKNKASLQGKTILDFGSGSGVVAIAAAKAGAARVIGCDIDPDALDAIQANAALNNVLIDTCRSLDEICDKLDLVIAADVLYDRENFHYLEALPRYAKEVLIADSRIKTLDLKPYHKVAEITATTLPDLDEPEACNRVNIYRAVFTG